MGRKPKTDKEVSDYGKRGTSQEKSVLMSLKDMVKTDGKVYYILWKYAPDLLPKNTLDNPINSTDNVARQNMFALKEGFAIRWEYMRKLLTLQGTPTMYLWLIPLTASKEFIHLVA